MELEASAPAAAPETTAAPAPASAEPPAAGMDVDATPTATPAPSTAAPDAATATPSPPLPPTPAPVECANCFKPGAELRCSICRKKSYCTVACQRTDWRFHKRICEKPRAGTSSTPAAAAATDGAPAASWSEGGDAGTGARAPAPSLGGIAAGASAGSGSAPAAAAGGGGGDDVHLDADDLAVLAEVKRKGYAHHARKLAESEVRAIGDIRPKAVAAVPPPAAAAAAAAASADGAPAAAGAAAAVVPAAAAAGGSLASASAWNSANTFESRSLGGWVRSRLKEVIAEARAAGDLVVRVPGVGRVEVTGISGWGDSTADIVISRGKSRWVYSISFAAVASVLPDAEAEAEEGVAAAAAGAIADEVEVDAEKEKEKAATAAATADKGGADAAAATAAAAAGAGSTAGGAAADAAKSAAPARRPRMLLRFPYVDNDTEGAAREVRVEWGSPAPPEAQHDILRRVAAVDSTAGLAAACRRVVERVITEFKAKQ